MLIRNNQIINGSIDHIDIGNSTGIDCSHCKDLITLPNWPNVTYVNCCNCPNLTFLPNWQNVTHVICCNCPNLTFLPNWENVTYIYCSNCPKLKKLQKWQNINNIWTSFPTIYYYPKLGYLNGHNISGKYHLKYIFDQHIKLDKTKNVVLNRDILYLLLNEYIK